MSTKAEKYEFKTETKKLLDIVIHSLYSNKEIFLRELISNASDAIDKVRFLSITNPTLLDKNEEFEIHLELDKKHNKLTIHDNGIGMSREEVIDKIGTIAKSGSSEFLKAYEKSKNLPEELIGQFGVGFYSSFMVAENVTLFTRNSESKVGTRWSSTGDGSFSVEDVEKEKRGTTIVIDLKKQEKDMQDFSDEWTIKSIVKKHSDFIAYPITMNTEKEENEKDDKGKEKKVKKIVKETLNSKEALWNKKADTIKEEEYDEFYKHIAHDWEKPLKVIHFSAEGRMEYKVLLYIPSRKPFSFNYVERDSRLSLYVKRVLIMDDCKDLLPPYLRFVKGLVDAKDLSLNISREMLQQDRNVLSIKTHLTKKVLDTLNDLKKDDFEKYKKFFGEFGLLIKEGIYTDYSSKDKLKDLLLFKSTKSDELSTLEEYTKRMQKDQKEIYFVSGDKLESLKSSPHLEVFKSKDFEVLFFTDSIDEFMVENLGEYDGKKFVSVVKGNIDLESDKSKKEERENREKKFDSLLKFMKSELSQNVKDVQYSRRLTDSAACLVSDKDDLSANMERILKATGTEAPSNKRILEINPDHKLIEVLNNLFEKDSANPKLKSYCELIYEQALLTEGSQLKDPVNFTKKITQIMLEAVGETGKSRIITI